MTNDFFTFLAGVGIQAVVAEDAVRVVLHLDVFASTQGLVAVLAVKPVTHDVSGWPAEQKIHRPISIHYQQEDRAGRRRSEIGKTERESRKKGGRQFLDIYNWEQNKNEKKFNIFYCSAAFQDTQRCFTGQVKTILDY